MNMPTFFATPGYVETQRTAMHYSQAVRIGNRVETSGRGGWNDDWTFPEALEDEIVQAFENVERTLAEAGATWRDVIAVNSYHIPTAADFIGEVHNNVMVQQFRKRMGDRSPIWTAVGVAALGAPVMRVEIRVTAIVSDERERSFGPPGD